jgi:sugar (pentulose or hexulose) kinase
MYNDHRAQAEATMIAAVAPINSAAQGAHCSLAKALWLLRQQSQGNVQFFLHQADWLAARLTGHFGITDENNALKLGYDPIARAWPDWINALELPKALLPRVVAPGTRLGPVLPDLAQRWNITQAQVVAGTTDSTAAFLATGAQTIGQAVTSLGSTLVLKVLAERPIFAPEYGVYSHRLGERWLVGGASNTGGAVLRQYFSNDQLRRLESNIDLTRPTGLNYYPLPGIGERFPVHDPQLQPRMTPRPSEDAVFLQGLLEGIAQIEQRGYRLLQTLGAPYPTEVISSGGGANNVTWRQLRERLLAVPVTLATHQDAAYGAALLACQSCTDGLS